MRPVMFDNDLCNSWQLIGEDFHYYPSIVEPNNERIEIYPGVYLPYSSTFTLSFTASLPKTANGLYIAYSIPYSYTNLQNLISNYLSDPMTSKHMKSRVLCRSLGGNKIDLITITDNLDSKITQILDENTKESIFSDASSPNGNNNISGDYVPAFMRKLQQKMKEITESMVDENNKSKEQKTYSNTMKPVIVIICRSQADSATSSLLCEGLLSILLSTEYIYNSIGRSLRRFFEFKIIPMFNPDGVINGHTIGDLAGQNLSTKWYNKSKSLFPQIGGIQDIISELHISNRLCGFIEIESSYHEIKTGIYFHGCKDKKSLNYLSLNDLITSLPNYLPKTIDRKENHSSIKDSTITNGSNKVANISFDPRILLFNLAKRSKLTNLLDSTYIYPKRKLSGRIYVYVKHRPDMCMTMRVSNRSNLTMFPSTTECKIKQRHLNYYDYTRYSRLFCLALIDCYKLPSNLFQTLSFEKELNETKLLHDFIRSNKKIERKVEKWVSRYSVDNIDTLNDIAAVASDTDEIIIENEIDKEMETDDLNRFNYWDYYISQIVKQTDKYWDKSNKESDYTIKKQYISKAYINLTKKIDDQLDTKPEVNNENEFDEVELDNEFEEYLDILERKSNNNVRIYLLKYKRKINKSDDDILLSNEIDNSLQTVDWANNKIYSNYEDDTDLLNSDSIDDTSITRLTHASVTLLENSTNGDSKVDGIINFSFHKPNNNKSNLSVPNRISLTSKAVEINLNLPDEIDTTKYLNDVMDQQIDNQKSIEYFKLVDKEIDALIEGQLDEMITIEVTRHVDQLKVNAFVYKKMDSLVTLDEVPVDQIDFKTSDSKQIQEEIIATDRSIKKDNKYLNMNPIYMYDNEILQIKRIKNNIFDNIKRNQPEGITVHNLLNDTPSEEYLTDESNDYLSNELLYSKRLTNRLSNKLYNNNKFCNKYEIKRLIDFIESNQLLDQTVNTKKLEQLLNELISEHSLNQQLVYRLVNEIINKDVNWDWLTGGDNDINIEDSSFSSANDSLRLSTPSASSHSNSADYIKRNVSNRKNENMKININLMNKLNVRDGNNTSTEYIDKEIDNISHNKSVNSITVSNNDIHSLLNNKSSYNQLSVVASSNNLYQVKPPSNFRPSSSLSPNKRKNIKYVNPHINTKLKMLENVSTDNLKTSSSKSSFDKSSLLYDNTEFILNDNFDEYVSDLIDF